MHKVVRCARAGGDADAFRAAEEVRRDVFRAGDEFCARALGIGDLAQTARVGAVRGPGDQHEVALRRELADGVLAFERGAADGRGFDEAGDLFAQDRGHLRDHVAVHGGLADAGVGPAGDRLEIAGVLLVREKMLLAMDAPEDALDLAVSRLAEEQHDVPLFRERRAAFLHLADQRTRGVDDVQRERLCARLDLLGNAVRAEDERGAGGQPLGFVDDLRAARQQVVHDRFVVDEVVQDEDGRPVPFQFVHGTVQRVAHARAEPGDAAEDHFHDMTSRNAR